jgi:Domain of unknown function (DUF4307)
VLPVLIVVGAVVMSLVAVKLYFEYGNDELTPTVISSNQITDTSITVTFQVEKSGTAAGSCTVEAFAYDDTQVGQAQVPVPAGAKVTVTYTLTTTSRPYVGEVPVCQPTQ